MATAVADTKVEPGPRRDPLRPALALVALAAGYFLAARLGLSLAVVHPSASAVWPPTGLAIATLLLGGLRLWPGVLAGAFAANLVTSGAALPSLAIGAGNTLEAVAAALLVNRFAGGARFFEEPRNLIRFVALAGLFAPAISATTGVTALALSGSMALDQAGAVWTTWWLGDAAGALVVAPLVVTVVRGTGTRWDGSRAAEGLALAAALVATGVVVFEEPFGLRNAPVAYLAFPPLGWAAFRFGARESMLAMAGLAAIAVHGTVGGRGPFGRTDPNESLLLLQGYLATIATLNLLLAALVARRNRAEEGYRRVQAELESRVQDRTMLLETANQQLREAEARLIEAQRVAGVGSWEWDVARNRVWWSEELYRLYGLDPGEFGASYEAFLERVHPDDRALVQGAVRTALDTGEPMRFEHRLVRPDGTIGWLDSRGRVVRGADGRPLRMSGTAQDIGDRKRAEEERAQLLREQIARREAEEANRAKDSFLATLSHELRTPLNSILGWTGLLESEQMRPDDVRRALDTIRRNALAQSRLISDILDLSSIDSGKLALSREPADLAKVVDSALDSVRPDAEKKAITLRSRLEAGVHAAVDHHRLHQVVLNVLGNAIKFVPRGGAVEVRLVREEGWGRIEIEDDGPGIPPELLPHVFDRYRQGDASSTRQHRGLGLGLAIVERLVALHGGTVAAANRSDRSGARFTIRLPLETGNTPPPPAPGIGKWQSLPVLRGLRLLVVDDDRDSRELTVEILARAGAEVTGRDSAPAARDAIRERVPDVLVTDIEMPGEDGYTLVRSIRSNGGEAHGVPAVALTAYARPEDARRAAESGFDAFLPKPVDPNALIRLVGALAHRRKTERAT